MVEEMYQQESMEEEAEDGDKKQTNVNKNNNSLAQTPTPKITTTATATTTASSSAPHAATTATKTTTTSTSPAGKRSEINAGECDPSLLAINRQGFSEKQAIRHPISTTITGTTTNIIVYPTNAAAAATAEVVPPPHGQPFHDLDEDTCRRGGMVAADYGTTISGNAAAHADIGPTIVRFGNTAAAGDVSLTLGLRHAGNMPEKSSNFSLGDFGGC